MTTQYSFGDLCRQTAAAPWRVRHALEARAVKPAGTFAGNHVYGPEALEQVRAHLAASEARRAACATFAPAGIETRGAGG